MIRLIAMLPALLFAQQACAAPVVGSGAAPPALIQCISAAMSTGPGDESGPLITDCVSVGSNACRNTQSDTSDTAIVRCDGEELSFWDALLTFELSTLQKSLKPEGLRSLRSSQKVWIPWRAARCDFVKTSEQGTKQVTVDVSFCMMETTALRAIDLMYAL
jgi:uncharacterized protein YecT (DUF1311 family)